MPKRRCSDAGKIETIMILFDYSKNKPYICSVGTKEIHTTKILPLPEWGVPLLRALYERSESGVVKKNACVDMELMIEFGIDRSTLWKYVEKLKGLGFVSNYPGRRRGKYIISEEVMSWFR